MDLCPLGTREGDDEASAEGEPNDGEEQEPEHRMEEEYGMDEQGGPQDANDSDPLEEVPAKVIKDPGLPSRKEMEEHAITHCPFRAWCAHCVAGKAREDPHWRMSQEIKEKGVAIISSDYCFLGQEGEEGNAIVLVTRDHQSRFSFAHYCHSKSCVDDPWKVQRTEEDIRLLGRSSIIYRVDNEPAILELQEKVKDLRILRTGSQTMTDNTPPKQSKSAGPIERGVQEIEEQIRTMKIALEERIQGKISINSLIFQWLVEYAAVLVNRFSIGHDGKTPYSRLRGRSSGRPIAEFGECILYKVTKQPGRLVKLEPRWKHGVWIGIDQKTNEAIIGTEEGTVRARSVRRRPISSRWLRSAIDGIRGSPRDPAQEPIRPDAQPEAQQPQPPPEVHRPDDEPEVPVPRQVYISKKDLFKYGYSVGCAGCIAIEKNNKHRKPHNEQCRRRIREAMKNDPEDQMRVELEEARTYNYMEKVKERMDKQEEKRKAAAEATQPPHEAHGPQEEEEGPPQAKRAKTQHEKAQAPEDQQPAESSSSSSSSSASPPPALAPSATRHTKRLQPEEEVQQALQEGNSDFQYLRPEDEEENPPEEPNAKRFKALHQMLMNNLGRKFTHVSEIFSPPRITKEAARRGLISGAAFDILQGWDARKEEDVAALMDHIETCKPLFINGSPPSTSFSLLQNLSVNTRNEKEFQTRLAEARQMLRVAITAYKKQAQGGRFFLHEHPLTATSWLEPEMIDLIRTPGTYFVQADLCQFGLTSWTAEGEEALVKKQTGFLTNSRHLAELLSRRCDGSHKHQHLLGEGRAAAAAIYPERLVSAIMTGIAREAADPQGRLIASVESKWSSGDVNVYEISETMREICTLQAHCDDTNSDWEQYYDDVSGQSLDASDVRAARAEEIKYLRQYGVYKKVPLSVMQQCGGRMIDTRWIDINKGDTCNKKYRSRIVAREIKRDSRQDLFAATPPLMSMRMLLSECASNQDKDHCLLFLDISRAYFNAKATRNLFIKIPPEDYEPGDEHKVGILMKSLYGTRDAAQNWENEYSSFLAGLGFTQGLASPCQFSMLRHGRKILVAVHGDDFSCTGNIHDLRWLASKFEGRYEVKKQLVGPRWHQDCVQEARVLNRLITWEETGIAYEADPRHAELIIGEMGLQQANSVKTPGEATPETSTQSTEMDSNEASRFRGIAARAMYLSLDRPDIAFAAKEAARSMAKPVKSDWAKLKRLARFLIGRPRLIMTYRWQADTTQVVGLSDADWAGDRVTRKSTSGGAIMRGTHLLHFWSNTQSIIATSSGESELYALTRCAAQVLGVMSFANDLNMQWQGSVSVDSSAAIAIAHRRGLQKLRHVHVQFLWIQQKIRDKEIGIHKISGHCNAADGLTKHVAAELCQKYMEDLHLEYRGGRHNLAPQSTMHVSPHHATADAAAPSSPLCSASSSSATCTPTMSSITFVPPLPRPQIGDFWVETNLHWIRNHNIPRRTLFTPCRTQGGPAIGEISKNRTTWVRGRPDAHHDIWVGKEAHAFIARGWTGATVFEKKKIDNEQEEIGISLVEVNKSGPALGEQRVNPSRLERGSELKSGEKQSPGTTASPTAWPFNGRSRGQPMSATTEMTSSAGRCCSENSGGECKHCQYELGVCTAFDHLSSTNGLGALAEGECRWTVGTM